MIKHYEQGNLEKEELIWLRIPSAREPFVVGSMSEGSGRRKLNTPIFM